MDKRVALNQIGTAKARLDEYFPQYKDIIEGTSIYLLPKENQLEERNQIAVELGAKSKVNIENTAAETINGSKATAIIVYFETLNQEQFVHFLFHEFGHVLSLNSNRTLYAEALKATESKNITSFSAGFAVWGELIAEAIAFRVEGKMPDDVPSTAVIRIQQELDAAVNVSLFNPYPFSCFCARYFEDPTIVLYRANNPDSIIGTNNCEKEIIPLLKEALSVVSMQLNQKKYWIIDRQTIISLGRIVEALFDYCFFRELFRKLI